MIRTKGSIQLAKKLNWILPLFFVACQSGSSELTPEEVVDQYVQWLHNGDIEQAKTLCTPAATAYLDALSAVIKATETPVESGQLRIESIKCVRSNDQLSIQCEGIIDDGFERYSEAYLLSLENGKWRIDHKPDSGKLHSSEEILQPEEE